MKKLDFIGYQLSRPISYIFIKHDDKYLYDWSIPFLLALIILSVFGFWLEDWSVVFKLIDSIAGFVQTLPGFFIAALAAIATFNREDIDVLMDGNRPPSIDTRINNDVVNVKLSRRKFLCLLFSYLTVQSFLISILGFVSASFEFVGEDSVLIYNEFVTWGFVSVFIFLSCQMLTSTLHGLYYLAERVHY
ncbi:hypothetical protein KDX00_03255 [Cobetia amphilecti]|nr:hypothetical protein KDX00_03255 [Cobetia litoralis]